MGVDKASLEHPDGGTFLSHAVERLRSMTSTVCVAGSVGEQSIGSTIVLPDPIEFRGPVTGLVRAMQFAKKQSADDKSSIAASLVTPIDMPNLSREDLGQILDLWRKDQRITCAASESERRPQPLVAIYPLAVLPELERLAASEDRSLLRWLKSQPHQCVTLSDFACHNANTPDELS